jgi:hypothetical protein
MIKKREIIGCIIFVLVILFMSNRNSHKIDIINQQKGEVYGDLLELNSKVLDYKSRITLLENHIENVKMADMYTDVMFNIIVSQRVKEWAKLNAKRDIKDSELEEIVKVAMSYEHWKLILAIISVESNFDRFAVSSVGATGLMQVMHSVWGNELGIPDINATFEIDNNISYGAEIINRYLHECDNNIHGALNRYVGGSSVYGKKVLSKYAELDLYIKTGVNMYEGQCPTSDDCEVVNVHDTEYTLDTLNMHGDIYEDVIRSAMLIHGIGAVISNVNESIIETTSNNVKTE